MTLTDTAFATYLLNEQEIGPDPLGVYPISWMRERMLPECAQDDPRVEAALTRVHGTGTLADFLRVDTLDDAVTLTEAA